MKDSVEMADGGVKLSLPIMGFDLGCEWIPVKT